MQEQNNDENFEQELRLNVLKLRVKNYRITMDDLRELNKVIPNATQIVADELGLTVDELMKQIETREVKQNNKFSTIDELWG